MKHIPQLFCLLALFISGCAVSADHYPKLATEQPAPAMVQDLFNPLTPTELETIKKRIDYFQPYMTTTECMKILDLPARQYPTSVWGERPGQSFSMMLREGSVLLIVCDRRGYVVSARLDDKKWEWKIDDKKP